MHNKTLFILAAFAFMLGIAGAIPAMAQDAGESAVSAPAVDAGNKICPVSGQKIDPATKATYEYEGKIYNFCCTGCIDEFKKNPQEYIKKVEEETQGAAQDDTGTDKGGMMGMQETSG